MVIPGTNGYDDFDDQKFGYKIDNNPFGTDEKIIFEGLNQKYRVFIAGYDVTPDVSNLTISQKLDGEMTCSFSLENTKNKYVITKEDLEINIPKIVENKSIRETSSRNFNTSASIDRVTLNSTINLKTTSSDGIISSDGVDISVGGRKVINHEINDVYNRRSYYWKSPTDSTPTSLNPQLMLKHMLFVVKWLSNIEKGEGECIFDYKEPVVVFLQGRFSPMWYFGFTGGLKDFNISYDYGGTQSINITCASRKYFLSKTVEVNSAVAKNFNLEAKNIDLRVNRSLNTGLKDVFTAKYLKNLFTTMFLKVSKPKTTTGTFVDLPPVPINYVDSSWLTFMEYYLNNPTNMKRYAEDAEIGGISEQHSGKDTPEIINLKKEISEQSKLLEDVKSDYLLMIKREQEARLKVESTRGNENSSEASNSLKQQYARAVQLREVAGRVYYEQIQKLNSLQEQLKEEQRKLILKSLERSVAQYLTEAVNNLFELLKQLFLSSSISDDPELSWSSIKDGSTVDKWMFYNDIDTVKFYKKYKENLINPSLLSNSTKKIIESLNSGVISQARVIDWSNPLNTNYSSTITDNIYQIYVFTTKPYTTRNVSTILDSNTARVWETDFCFAEDSDYTTIDGIDEDGNKKKYYQFRWKSKYSAGIIGIHSAVNEDFINKFHILPQIFGLAVDNDRVVEIKEKTPVVDDSEIKRTVSELSVAPVAKKGNDDIQFFPKNYRAGVRVQGKIADKLEEIFSEINDRIESSDGRLEINSIIIEAHSATQNDTYTPIEGSIREPDYPNGIPKDGTVITILYDPSPYNAARAFEFTKKLANYAKIFYSTDRRFTSGKYKYESIIRNAFDKAKEKPFGFFVPAGLDENSNEVKQIEGYYGDEINRIKSGLLPDNRRREKFDAPLLKKYNVDERFPDTGVNFSKPGSNKYLDALYKSREKLRANRRIVVHVKFKPFVDKNPKGGVKVNKIRNAVRTPYEKLKEQVYGVPTDVDPNVDGINFHRPRFIVMLPPIYATDVTVTDLLFKEYNVFNAQHINLKQVIDEFIKSIQFKYFETPVGDVILEPINYDFSPWEQVSAYGELYGKYSTSDESDVNLNSFMEQPSSSELKSVTIIPPYITTYFQPRDIGLSTLPIVKPKINFRHPYYFNNMNEKNVTFRFKPDSIYTSITVTGLPPGSSGAIGTAAANTIFNGEITQDISRIAYATTQPLGINPNNPTSQAFPTATYVADGFEETSRNLDIDFKIAAKSLAISAHVQGLVLDIYRNDVSSLIKKLKSYRVNDPLKEYQPTLDGLITNIVWPILYKEIRSRKKKEIEITKPANKKEFNKWLINHGRSASEISKEKIKINVYDTILAEIGYSKSPNVFPIYILNDKLYYIYDYPLFKKEHINPRDGVTILNEVRVDYLKSFPKITSKIFSSLKKPVLKKGATTEDIKRYEEELKAFNTTVKDNMLSSLDDMIANNFIPKLMKAVFLATPVGKKAVEDLKNIYSNSNQKKPSVVDKSGNSSKSVTFEPKITTFEDFSLARSKGEYNPQADFVTRYGIKPYQPIKVPYLRTSLDCKMYAIALFNQLYNNAFEYSYSSIPLTPEILVNRTGYFNIYNMIGLINGITHTINYGDNSSTSIDISYPRRNILQSNYSIIDYDFDKAPKSDYINASPYVAGSTNKFDSIKDMGILASYGISNFSVFRTLGALYEVTKVKKGKLSLNTMEAYKNFKNDLDKINFIISNLIDKFKYYYTRFNSAYINLNYSVLEYKNNLYEFHRAYNESKEAASEEDWYYNRLLRSIEKNISESNKKATIDAFILLVSYIHPIFGFAFKEKDLDPDFVDSKGVGLFAKNLLTAYPYLPEPVTAIMLIYKEYQKGRIKIGNDTFEFQKIEEYDFKDSEMNKLCLKRKYENNKLIDTSIVQPILPCLVEALEIKSKIEEYGKNI
jgi:RNA binding exosome subunit